MNKKTLIIVGTVAGVVLLSYPLFIIGSMLPEIETPTTIEAPTEEQPMQETPKYDTKETIVLKDSEQYLFAVESETYDGDVVQAGNYSFSVNTTGQAGVFDVYILDEEPVYGADYGTSSCTIGGANNESCNLELTAGQFVVIQSTPVVYNSSGTITITQQ